MPNLHVITFTPKITNMDIKFKMFYNLNIHKEFHREGSPKKFFFSIFFPVFFQASKIKRKAKNSQGGRFVKHEPNVQD